MKYRTSVPLVLGFVVIAVGAASVVHPAGLSGVLGLSTEHTGDGPSAPVTGGGPKQLGTAVTELRKADSAYDRGDFDGAITFYMTSSALARDAAERSRATRGLHRSVLGLALVHGAPATTSDAAAARTQLTALRERAESADASPEAGWLAALRFAAGARLTEELPGLLRPCIDEARAGGPVEKQLMDCLGRLGTRDKTLRQAMVEKGLGGDVVRRSLSTGSAPVTYDDEGDDGPSGIGGSASRHIPWGAFSAETRKALARAVSLEEQGLEEFKLAGPDGTNRGEHRKRAHVLLKEARGIYDAAIDEDPDSRDLQARHKRVRMALALLSKERSINE